MLPILRGELSLNDESMQIKKEEFYLPKIEIEFKLKNHLNISIQSSKLLPKQQKSYQMNLSAKDFKIQTDKYLCDKYWIAYILDKLSKKKQQKRRMQESRLFVTNKICPFAQRVWIVLEELNLPYQRKEVPIFAGDPYLKEIYSKAEGHDPSSDGKVPVLVDNGFILAESGLIVDFLVKKYSDRNPTFTDPQAVIRSKIFNKKNNQLMILFYSFKQWHSFTFEKQEKLIARFQNCLERLQKSLVLPYALGDYFSVADIMLYPWIVRWLAIQRYIGVSINPKYRNILKWIRHVKERKSVSVTLLSPQFYIKGYESYFMKPKL